jgi:hypothetical protein
MSRDYKWGAIKGRKTQPRTSVDGLKISAKRDDDGLYVVTDADTGELVGYLGGRLPGPGWFAKDAEGNLVVEQVQLSRTTVASQLKTVTDRRKKGELTPAELLESARQKLTKAERAALAEAATQAAQDQAHRDAVYTAETLFQAIVEAPSHLAAIRIIEKQLADERAAYDRFTRDRSND